MLTNTEAEALFKRCRNKERGYKFANNTRIQKRGRAYAIRLHKTDVAIIRPDGTYRLNSNGWRTVITRDRINRVAPCCVEQTKGIWHIGKTLYEDGMLVDASGKPTRESQHTLSDVLNLKSQVDRTITRFIRIVEKACVGRDIGTWESYSKQPTPNERSKPHIRELWELIRVTSKKGEWALIAGPSNLFIVAYLATKARGHGDPQFVWTLMRDTCLRGGDAIFIRGNLRAFIRHRKQYMIEAILAGELVV